MPIRCDKCGGANIATLDSRPMDSYVRRRRKCLNCDHRFTTYEVEAILLSQVIQIEAKKMAKKMVSEGIKENSDKLIDQLLNQYETEENKNV